MFFFDRFYKLYIWLWKHPVYLKVLNLGRARHLDTMEAQFSLSWDMISQKMGKPHTGRTIDYGVPERNLYWRYGDHSLHKVEYYDSFYRT